MLVVGYYCSGQRPSPVSFSPQILEKRDRQTERQRDGQRERQRERETDRDRERQRRRRRKGRGELQLCMSVVSNMNLTYELTRGNCGLLASSPPLLEAEIAPVVASLLL